MRASLFPPQIAHVRHRIHARAPRDAAPPAIHDDPGVLASFSSDAAHVAGGFAAGIAFPRDEAEIAALVSRHAPILTIGAQSSLTGGATPRGELIVSTRHLTSIARAGGGHVRVGAGVALAALQTQLAAWGLFYPPGPTFDGAFLGGTVATNAAGPATFKYGSTRDWVASLTVVLACGDILDLDRGRAAAEPGGCFEIARPSGHVIRVPVPRYTMPRVAKLSAGHFAAAPETDLIDLFIGSEGTLGVIAGATVRTVPRPARTIALIVCRDDTEAIEAARRLRDEARAAWAGHGGLDAAAIEYIDARGLELLPDAEFERAALRRPPPGAVAVIVHLESAPGEDPALERLQALLDSCGVDTDPILSLPGDDAGAATLLRLREAVPAAVNAAVAATKARVDRRIEKTAGDMIVPFEHVGESLAIYRDAFARRGLDCAVWGHLSDGNLHPNLIPGSWADVEQGRDALLEVAGRIHDLGGAPLAEHGVGRSPLKQRLLRDLYGEAGIDEMRAVKRALDPDGKLAPGVLFPAVDAHGGGS
jgi:D-lactate dehydrogenase (cytochrome)